jgi:hypothetical protein
MGSLGGINWYRKHECPPPYDATEARFWLEYGQRFPVYPRQKARVLMAWRHGLLPELGP